MAKHKKYTLLSNCAYVLANVWQWDKVVLVFIAVSAISGVLIPYAGIYMPKSVIDTVTATPSIPSVAYVIALYTVAITALNAANKYTTGYVNASAMSNRMRYLFLSNDKAMRTDYDNIESAAGQQMRNKLNAAVNSDRGGPQLILRTLPTVISGLVGIAVYGAVLSKLNPIIFALLIATSIANYFVLRKITQYLEKHRNDYSKMMGKFVYLAFRMQDFSIGKDIRIYNMKPWFMTIFDNLLKQDNIRQWKSARAEYMSNIADATILLLCDGIAYAFLIYYVTHAKIGVSDFVLYFGAIMGFSGFISAITSSFNDFVKSSLDITAIREFLENPDRKCGTRTSAGELPVSIEFCNVSFRYADEQPYTLKNLNLKIKKGEKIALVGINGAGKTTIIKLLCGFYRPTEGEIRLNGVPLPEYERDSVYGMMTVVFQDILILPLSVARNVAMTDDYDEGRVADCIARAGLSARLPDIHASLTKITDPNGIELSGGEQQKLLLARALYKDAPIMLLDEPTAALDPIAESILYKSYNDLSSNKTSIYISHRLASASFCDRVAYLENGTIAEIGTHKELIQYGGAYAHMYKLQSHYYQEDTHE